jgi:hypothetical protein
MYIPICIGTVVMIGVVLYLFGFGVSTRTVPVRHD